MEKLTLTAIQEAYSIKTITDQKVRKIKKNQLYESVKIVNSKIEDDIQLNDKDEFNQAMIITAKYTKGVH